MEKRKKTCLYILQGFIGSGKTTFSKKLSVETGAIHLNPDEWVTKIYNQEDYINNWDKCFDEVLTLLWEKTKEYLKNGTDVILDMGFWYKKDREFAKHLAFECNSDFKHFYLDVPDSILKERIVASRPSEWVKIHLENFENNKKLFEIPQADEDFIVIKNY